MLHQRLKNQRYNLEELAIAAALDQEAVPNLRTLRSWIKAGVLHGPDGMGQGKHYGERHWVRLRFLLRLQEKLKGARLPLRWLSKNLEGIADEATIRRIALGQESLTILGMEDIQEDWPEISGSWDAPEVAAAMPASKPSADPTGTGPWTTIDVTDDVSLRLKGDDPEQVVRLAKMARHLREWTEEEF